MKVFGVCGWKNNGKTGLVERLAAELTRRGVTVSTLKHAHHDADVDQPGRDSHRHRQAGARQVLLATPRRWALMTELRGAEEPPLEALLARLDPVDLVLIEGWKRGGHPKIEAHRAAAGRPVIAREDPSVRAVATDTPLEGLEVPQFDLDDTAALADFLLAETGLAAEAGAGAGAGTGAGSGAVAAESETEAEAAAAEAPEASAETGAAAAGAPEAAAR